MEIDYQKIGFKAGLEIHQQLDTRKLFCNCPSIFRSDDPEIVVRRKLHVVAGEAGEIDEAAEHEASLGNEFVYQVYNTNCLVELDEEPPHEINKDALGIALQISALLNASVIPITQIMRKTVINGSNTSGFQRTVMIARDGFVDTSFGRVGISGIFLEEDSARLVSKKDGEVVYRLDRLGIPLVEISTMPDIKNAEQAKETALKLGEILRACQVKRGIGTIRQDINISIKEAIGLSLRDFRIQKL
jgi:glutamyl-tRNA(Gln) amidotransferase subunit E